MSNALPLETVRRVAFLARLRLSDQELADYATKLGDVLEYVKTLNEVDTSSVQPMVHAVELSNVFREDQVLPSLPRSEALQNAPKTDGTYFLVPQILEEK